MSISVNSHAANSNSNRMSKLIVLLGLVALAAARPQLVDQPGLGAPGFGGLGAFPGINPLFVNPASGTGAGIGSGQAGPGGVSAIGAGVASGQNGGIGIASGQGSALNTLFGQSATGTGQGFGFGK